MMIFTCFITLEVDIDCIIHYPYFTVWYWFATAFPLNIIFSTIFCHVAFQQYRQHGKDAWKRLARDGVQAMCSAALCNIICCVVAVLQAFGPNSDLLLVADW